MDSFHRSSRFFCVFGWSAAGGRQQRISADAGKILFLSTTTQVVPYPPPSGRHLFVFDRHSHSYDLVDQSSIGVMGNGSVTDGSISGDGSLVAFGSAATNLGGPGSVGSTLSVFLRDRSAGTTIQLNRPDQRVGGGAPQISADGRFLVFGAASQGNHCSPWVYDRNSGTMLPADV